MTAGREPTSRRWLGWVVLAAVVIAAYAPALRGEFLRWGDPDQVFQNPRVVAPDGLRRSWSETGSPGFSPIPSTAFYLEWRAARGKPWLFHLDNVLVHAANAVMVAQLGLRLGLAPAASGFLAAVWALHPLQVATVAWAAERKNLLYVFFYLASLHLYLLSEGGRASRAAYVASVACLPLALLCNGAAVTLPAAIVIVEWARGGVLGRRFWTSVLPYAAVVLAGGLALVGSVPGNAPMASFGVRLMLAPRAVWFYVASFSVPLRLLPMYPRWPLEPDALGGIVGWLVLGAAVGALVLLGRRISRLLLAGIAFFLVNVALVVGIVWFTDLGHSPVGDHLAYLPSLGLALAAVGGARGLSPRVPARALRVGLAVWVGVLAIATWRYIPVWHDTERLWRYTLEYNPGCAFCHSNLARLLEDRGQGKEAIEHYETALRLEPDAGTAINLGNLRLAQGRTADAAALYRRAVQLDRTSEEAHFSLGLVLASQGKTEEAVVHYREAVRLTPGSVLAQRVLAQALDRLGQRDEAITHYQAVYRLQPDDEEVITDLAAALAARERVGEAVALLRERVARTPDSVPLVGSLAWIRATSRDAEWRDGGEAVRLAEHACEMTGNGDPDLLDTLAAAYAEAGRFDDAIRTEQRALQAGDPAPDLAEEMRRRLVLYTAGQPYRSP